MTACILGELPQHFERTRQDVGRGRRRVVARGVAGALRGAGRRGAAR